MEKKLNKEEYDEKEYLDKYVQGKNPEIYIEGDEIGLNGYIFELDRSVPRLGKYKGQETGPRIKEIKITNKTTNSVTVEVEARNVEDADYTYSYQKVGEEEWHEVETSKNNTCTIGNLESNESYTIKVRIETEEGETEGEISTTIGELPEGTITFGEVEWIGDGTASVAINTSETGYYLQYQKNSIEGQWTTIGSGQKITGLVHNDTVYGRLFDGVNGTKEEASVSIQDGIDPVVTVSPGTKTTNSIQVSVSAVDNESGMADSLTYTYYIKKTSEADSSYVAKANGIAQNSYTFSGLTQETSYDVKVEVVGDKAGRKGTGTLLNQTTGKVGGATGDLTTGNIVASTPTWASGTASITLTTTTGMQIQYQINGIIEENWTTVSTGAIVSGLHHNDTVYARLYDGTNTGDYGSVSIQDGVDPIVTVSPGGIRTNSITVSAVAVDNESGMADNVTYTYYIKKTSEPETSYVAKASDIAQNSYTFSGLQQETSYDVKVEVVGDKAGRKGTGTLPNQTTTKVGGATGDLTTGNIVASTPTWASGTASITLTTTTGMQIQYQVNGITEGSWTTVSTGATVSGLHHNDTVYARLFDGTNTGDYGSVSIIDNIAPTVSISTSNLTSSSVTLKVTASDGQSGLATSGTYKYYLGSTLKTTSTSSSYNYTGLTASTSYTLKVIVTDNAGKTTEKSTTIKTSAPPEYVDSVLPSAPELAAGMTPVKWNGSNWIKTTKTDSEWYDYANKEWANVVLGDATFSGNTLDESKPYSMLVWIPRYAYKISSCWHLDATGIIDVVFIDEKNKSKNGTIYNGTYNGSRGTYSNYVVHPAFNYGNSNENKLRGIWVGKYETSNTDCTTTESTGRYDGTDKTIQIKAGVTSWRYITVSNIYTVCTQMNKSGNPYGLSTSDSVVDPHMMKNTEWGAVAYLSKSKYGKETEEVWINPNSNYITGRAGSSVSTSGTTSTTDYKSTNGQKASTTGNITGVYDMSGGAWEYVAAYVNNGNGNLITYGSKLVNAAAKYKDVYSKGSSDTNENNYAVASSKYGDAVYETSSIYYGSRSWYSDISAFPCTSKPFFLRGGSYSHEHDAGVFGFSANAGSTGDNVGFRLVMPVL